MVKVKVLVVDKSESTRVFLRFVLSNAGFLVVAIASVEEALELTDDFMFDTIIVDLDGKDMDGLGLIRELRMHNWYENAPIVAVSINNTDEAKQAASEAGASEWMLKPVAPHKLTTLIKEISPDKEDDDAMSF